jgi:hypothetical protein
VYFEKIKVVIPKSWSTQTHYKQLPALSSLETYININNWKISSPHVRSKTYQCGEEGLAMYLQPSFFLQTGRSNYGNHGKYRIYYLYFEFNVLLPYLNQNMK